MQVFTQRLIVVAVIVLGVRYGLPLLQGSKEKSEDKVASLTAGIDSLRASQAALRTQLGSERTAVLGIYEALKVKRENLKHTDAASVQQYNEEAALYEKRKAGLAEMQKQFDANEAQLAGLIASRGRANEALAKSQQVIVYSTSWCGACKVAKQYLTEKRIPFVEYDIERDANAHREFKKLGGTGVPLIVINGEHEMGFSSAWIDQQLAKR